MMERKKGERHSTFMLGANQFIISAKIIIFYIKSMKKKKERGKKNKKT